MADRPRTPVKADAPGYRFVRGFSRLVVGLFYRRMEVVGRDRLPAAGPVLVAANHQNGLVDPMVLVATVDRSLVALAKAPLFRHPLISPFLRLVGAIPVQRRQDVGGERVDNEAMFESAIAALGHSRALLIFPEGTSRPEPRLRPLRTGAARIVLAAELAAGGRLGVRLVPVGLVFHEPGAFRAGRGVVFVGEPVATTDCIALYERDPAAAVRQLTDRLAQRLRALLVEADDRQTLRLLELVEAMWREESGTGASDAGARAAWMQQALRAYRYVSEREPDRAAGFRRRVEHYAKALELAGLTPYQLSQSYPREVVARYVVREGLSLVLGLPLALLGIVVHALPYGLTTLALRAIPHEPDEEATYGIAAAIVLYPLCWALEAWLAWRLGGTGWLVAFLVALGPTGFFALSWRARLDRVRREARGFLGFLLHRDLRRQLVVERRALVEEMATLARRVPETVLTGEGGTQGAEGHEI